MCLDKLISEQVEIIQQIYSQASGPTVESLYILRGFRLGPGDLDQLAILDFYKLCCEVFFYKHMQSKQGTVESRVKRGYQNYKEKKEIRIETSIIVKETNKQKWDKQNFSKLLRKGQGVSKKTDSRSPGWLFEDAFKMPGLISRSWKMLIKSQVREIGFEKSVLRNREDACKKTLLERRFSKKSVL